MIDKEYIKEIISRITKKKAEGIYCSGHRFDERDYDCCTRGCPGVHEDHVRREGDCGKQDVE